MTAPDPSKPLVSVVMANFRGAAHLEPAMRAVLAQSERRLELILADDASDDDSVAIARAVAEGDHRVRVIASPRNRGPAATRNLALEAARGRAGLDASRPATIAWLDKIHARPAYQAALAKGGTYAYA